jgi:hypothetical protein
LLASCSAARSALLTSAQIASLATSLPTRSTNDGHGPVAQVCGHCLPQPMEVHAPDGDNLVSVSGEVSR